jgi:virulence-associated protein VapD
VKFRKYTAAYGNIRRFLEKSGFDHDQGSGDVSKAAMSLSAARRIFIALGQKNPWLVPCMPKCRLTSFDDGAMTYTDLLPDVQTGAKLAEQGTGLTPSPTGYGAARDGQAGKQADALRATLTTTNPRPSPALAQAAPAVKAQAPAVAPQRAASAAITKTPLKSKGGGNAGM